MKLTLTEGYSLRPFRRDDAEALHRILSDLETMRYIEPPFTREQTAAFLENQGLCDVPRILALADSADRCAGHVIFHPYDGTSYEIGWVIGREHRGRGLAKAVTSALLELCRGRGIRRAVIEHHPAQQVTAHIARSLGFFAMQPEDGLRRWCFHVDRPDILPVDDDLRLRRFDGAYAFALPWYEDEETVYLVDGVREPYSMERLTAMYSYLDANGELYMIEALENGTYVPIGDVTFWQEDMPIVIGDPRYRGRGVGRRVVAALCDRAKALGYDRVYVHEIYDDNTGSRRCFESAGFSAYEKTEKGSRYVRELPCAQERVLK